MPAWPPAAAASSAARKFPAFLLQQVQPGPAAGAREAGPGLLGQPQIDGGVPPGQLLRLAAFRGQLPGQLPDDLQHEEARFRFAGRAPDQAVIAQLLQRRQGFGAQVRAADRLDLREARAAGENRKAAEQAARRGPQQIVAPEDRRAQGLLPGGQVPGASGQEGQAGAEAGQQGGGREKADPRRGQLQGQGQPVQAADDPGHRGRVFRGQPETGADRLGPGHEQGHRLA